jgi:predicted RNA-binding Zn ribbon-like protein
VPPIEEQPGGREPAPGELGVVQSFVNTNDIEGRRDRAGRPELMSSWLREHGLVDADHELDGAGFVRLVTVREALRALALANNGFPLEGEQVEILNRAARGALEIDFSGQGVVSVSGEGVDGAVGKLLAPVVEAMRSGDWARMKACSRDACRWVYYDHSRNRSSSWCSMAICGNREKTRAYRRRRRDRAGS